MAQVIIIKALEEEINKNFKGESVEVFSLLLTLKENPKKGKDICFVGKTLLKEIRYKSFRFYFITDGYKVKFLKPEELKDLLIKFVRMSDKDKQQETIDEIKYVLRKLGEEGF